MLASPIIILYLCLSIAIIWGWNRLKNRNTEVSENKLTAFSIVIAMRNEAENIEVLLESIGKLDYPTNAYEVCLIDDHSTDNSVELARQFGLPNLKVIPSQGEGKKSAIETGINWAAFDYIIQTDADCKVPKHWLKIMNSCITEQQVQLMACPLIIEDNGRFFSNLQSLESYALLMSTAGLFGTKHPVMMNAANVAYQKPTVKNQDVLNQKVTSGDDVFLLHRIKEDWGMPFIHFINHPKATVTTLSEKNLQSFWQQRIRWAGKSKHYQDFDAIIVGLIVLLVNISIPILLIMGIFSEYFVQQALIIWLGKLLLDLAMLIPVLKSYKKMYLLSYFPLLTAVYPFYVSFVGVVSQFSKFKWKNRVYHGA